ncbi:MAG: hypothetical protein ACT4QF_21930 [Sporichthyaceae bacterium]
MTTQRRWLRRGATTANNPAPSAALPGRRGWRIRVSPDGTAGCLRPAVDIERQYTAALGFSTAVASLEPAAPRYTAGLAATLGWLRGRTGHPLPGTSTSRWQALAHGRVERTGSLQAPQLREVRDLERRARGLVEPDLPAVGAADEADPATAHYAAGILHACRWALQHTDDVPFAETPG